MDAHSPAPTDSVADNGTWLKFVHRGDMWWHNAVLSMWFYEATGTQEVPCTTYGGNCCKNSDPDPDDDIEGSTEAGDDALSLSEADTMSCAASSYGPASATLHPISGGGYAGLCTHRTYAHNLYRPGQLPQIPEL